MHKESKKSSKNLEHHKVEFAKTNTMNMNDSEEDSSRLVPLSRNDFNMGVLENWCEIRAKNQPKRRSFHSGFLYNDYLYIVAGIDIAAGKLNDIKRINLNDDGQTWEDIRTAGVTLGRYLKLICRTFSLPCRVLF